MGANLRKCFGMDAYIRVREEYGAHPGLHAGQGPVVVATGDTDAYTDENPESLFDERTGV